MSRDRMPGSDDRSDVTQIDDAGSADPSRSRGSSALNDGGALHQTVTSSRTTPSRGQENRGASPRPQCPGVPARTQAPLGHALPEALLRDAARSSRQKAGAPPPAAGLPPPNSGRNRAPDRRADLLRSGTRPGLGHRNRTVYTRSRGYPAIGRPNPTPRGYAGRPCPGAPVEHGDSNPRMLACPAAATASSERTHPTS
jgi:hypothetical protein